MKSSEGQWNGVMLSDRQWTSVKQSERQSYNTHLHSILLTFTETGWVRISEIECRWTLYICLPLAFTELNCQSLSVTPFRRPSLDFIGHGYSKYSISYFCPENPLIPLRDDRTCYRSPFRDGAWSEPVSTALAPGQHQIKGLAPLLISGWNSRGFN